MTESFERRAAILDAPDQVPLTTEQVAEATGLSEWTLRKWASKRQADRLLPSLKRAGRNLYRPADVRRWMGAEVGASAAA